MEVCSLTNCSLREGRYRCRIVLALCLALFWVWQGEAEELPRIVLLSPREDRYFFPFLEVFLRRIMPGYEITTLSPDDIVPSRKRYIVVGFSEELRRVRLPKGKVDYILLGERNGVAFPLLGQVAFRWQETALAICKSLCAGGRRGFLFWGESTHPLFVLLEELCEDGERSGASVVFVDRISRVRPFLEKSGGSSSLVVLEAATEVLFALQEGKVRGVVDTKPSEVAQCIAAIVQGKSDACAVTPLFVTQDNIFCADAYEVVRRCLSCQ